MTRPENLKMNARRGGRVNKIDESGNVFDQCPYNRKPVISLSEREH